MVITPNGLDERLYNYGYGSLKRPVVISELKSSAEYTTVLDWKLELGTKSNGEKINFVSNLQCFSRHQRDN